MKKSKKTEKPEFDEIKIIKEVEELEDEVVQESEDLVEVVEDFGPPKVEVEKTSQMANKLIELSNLVQQYLDFVNLNKKVGVCIKGFVEFHPKVAGIYDDNFSVDLKVALDSVRILGAELIKDSHFPGLTIPRLNRLNWEVVKLQSICNGELATIGVK